MPTVKEQYQKFVELLRSNTETAVQTFIKPKYQKITGAVLTAKIRELFPGMAINLYDQQYQLMGWESWLQFIDLDWTDRKKYLTDTYDCDNFSGSFCSRAAELLNVNTAGRFTCTIITGTGERIAHRAVLIAAIDENDKLALYVFESQNDKWFKVNSSTDAIVIPNDYGESWRYYGNLTKFN